MSYFKENLGQAKVFEPKGQKPKLPTMEDFAGWLMRRELDKQLNLLSPILEKDLPSGEYQTIYYSDGKTIPGTSVNDVSVKREFVHSDGPTPVTEETLYLKLGFLASGGGAELKLKRTIDETLEKVDSYQFAGFTDQVDLSPLGENLYLGQAITAIREINAERIGYEKAFPKRKKAVERQLELTASELFNKLGQNFGTVKEKLGDLEFFASRDLSDDGDANTEVEFYVIQRDLGFSFSWWNDRLYLSRIDDKDGKPLEGLVYQSKALQGLSEEVKMNFAHQLSAIEGQ